ncbi:GlxA family transcriptional regulator [Amycolatopsis sp. FDAARGOS 1241]|uniref:GlxA family transcriptional regulator n=1 Tax=Amycolatopsis sp. FDAARGOS 1241 TaxID=2778070 RepID=UPI00194E7D55|nr:helix-turn-helix domain-containing protein [Amycolatopsis sp. FDAARGOS 1241]QRP47757.1 helix-turn-helix domain-containing protein [Amycolatopsis sp. FDAARGOS 1241]
MSRTEQLTVALLAVPRVIPLDFSIPVHLLGGQAGYRVLVCGDERDAAAGITPTHPLADVPEADIVIVPGYEEPEAPLPEEYLDAIRRSADRGGRVVAICTGTFALAQAGILDEREATTHWRFLASLRERYPLVRVIENQLFVEHGKILTSAGAGAGIDACLHLIRTDFGEAAAHEAGKDVVAAPARDGAQPQYVDVLTSPRANLSATRSWVMEHIGDPITVQRMAERSNLPRRTFIRRFELETGMSPMRWVVSHRILSARRLLETSDWPIERIAAATGFGTAANFRASFRREVGTTPTTYRRTHSVNGRTPEGLTPDPR